MANLNPGDNNNNYSSSSSSSSSSNINDDNNAGPDAGRDLEATLGLEEDVRARRSSTMSSATRRRRRRSSGASSMSSGGSSMHSVVEVPLVSDIFPSETVIEGAETNTDKFTNHGSREGCNASASEGVEAQGADAERGHRIPQDGEELPQEEESVASDSRRSGFALIQSQIAEFFVNKYVEMAMALTSILYMCLVYSQVALALPGSPDTFEVWKAYSIASLVFLSIFACDVVLRMLAFGRSYWATLANCMEFCIVMAALALEPIVYQRLEAASSDTVPGVNAVTIINSVLKLLLFLFRYRRFEYIISIKYLQAQALSSPMESLSASDRVLDLLREIRRKYPLTTREAQEVNWASYLIGTRRLYSDIAVYSKADEDTEKLFEALDEDTTNWLLATYSHVQLQESGANANISPPGSPGATSDGARLNDLGESDGELMPAFSLDDEGNYIGASTTEEPESEREASEDALHSKTQPPSSPRHLLGPRSPLHVPIRDSGGSSFVKHLDASTAIDGEVTPAIGAVGETAGDTPSRSATSADDVGSSMEARALKMSPTMAPHIISPLLKHQNSIPNDGKESTEKADIGSPMQGPAQENSTQASIPIDGPPADLGRHISGGSVGIQARDLTFLIEALLRETYTPPMTPDHVPAATQRPFRRDLGVTQGGPASMSYNNLIEIKSAEATRPNLSVTTEEDGKVDNLSESTIHMDSSMLALDASSPSIVGKADGQVDSTTSRDVATSESRAGRDITSPDGSFSSDSQDADTRSSVEGESTDQSPSMLPSDSSDARAHDDVLKLPELRLKPLSLHNRSLSTSVAARRGSSQTRWMDGSNGVGGDGLGHDGDDDGEVSRGRHYRRRTSGADREFLGHAGSDEDDSELDYHQLPPPPPHHQQQQQNGSSFYSSQQHTPQSSPVVSQSQESLRQPQYLRQNRDRRARAAREPVDLVGADGLERLKLLAGELSHLKSLRWTQGELDSLNDKLDTWDFDVFEADTFSAGRPLSLVLLGALRKNHIFEQFRGLRLGMVVNMISNMENGYRRTNPYHNRVHAADVVQTTHYFMTHTLLRNAVTTQDVFCALVAAAIHDYQHPGLNNAFLVATGNKLAVRYNDRAVLEHMHVASAFEVMRSKRCDILRAVGGLDRYLEARETVIQMVLATDMSHHFEGLEKFNTDVVQYYERISAKRKARGHNVHNHTASSLDSIIDGDLEGGHALSPEGGAEDVGGERGLEDQVAPLEVRRTLLKTTLHCADVSNPAKDPRLSRHWATLVQEEFFQQGDREREAGLKISTFMDRTKPAFPKSQIGFITIIVRPLFNSYCQFLSTLKPQVDWCLSANLAHWEQRQAEEEEAQGFGAALQSTGQQAGTGSVSGSPLTGPSSFQRRKSFRFVSSRIKTTLSRSQTSAPSNETPARRRATRSGGLVVDIPPPSPRASHTSWSATPFSGASPTLPPSASSQASMGAPTAPLSARMSGPAPLRRSATDMAINIGRTSSSSSHRFLP